MTSLAKTIANAAWLEGSRACPETGVTERHKILPASSHYCSTSVLCLYWATHKIPPASSHCCSTWSALPVLSDTRYRQPAATMQHLSALPVLHPLSAGDCWHVSPECRSPVSALDCWHVSPECRSPVSGPTAGRCGRWPDVDSTQCQGQQRTLLLG